MCVREEGMMGSEGVLLLLLRTCAAIERRKEEI